MGAELEWIDEDADDDALRELARPIHETEMARVEEPHGGNEADRVAVRALGARPGAHLGDGGDFAHGGALKEAGDGLAR